MLITLDYVNNLSPWSKVSCSEQDLIAVFGSGISPRELSQCKGIPHDNKIRILACVLRDTEGLDEMLEFGDWCTLRGNYHALKAKKITQGHEDCDTARGCKVSFYVRRIVVCARVNRSASREQFRLAGRYVLIKKPRRRAIMGELLEARAGTIAGFAVSTARDVAIITQALKIPEIDINTDTEEQAQLAYLLERVAT